MININKTRLQGLFSENPPHSTAKCGTLISVNPGLQFLQIPDGCLASPSKPRTERPSRLESLGNFHLNGVSDCGRLCSLEGIGHHNVNVSWQVDER